MRTNAYVLAADPAWVERSIMSYYSMVRTIVVSYDRGDRGWTGAPMSASDTVARIKAVDSEQKCVFVPGDFCRPDIGPLDADTAQRQVALDLASEGADWVIQLDTDEIVTDQAAMAVSLRAADERLLNGLEFPARRVVQHVRGNWFVEDARIGWRFRSNYPGPVAVRVGTKLTLCRQGPQELYRVDIRPKNTDPAHPRTAPIHATVKKSQTITHLSWVRSENQIAAKLAAGGHAHERDWRKEIELWRFARERPIRSIVDPRRRVSGHWMRLVRLPGLLTPAERLRDGLLS